MKNKYRLVGQRLIALLVMEKNEGCQVSLGALEGFNRAVHKGANEGGWVGPRLDHGGN